MLDVNVVNGIGSVDVRLPFIWFYCVVLCDAFDFMDGAGWVNARGLNVNFFWEGFHVARHASDEDKWAVMFDSWE